MANDGGDTVVYFYYGGGAGVSPARWNVLETRNGSSQATRQWVWGQGGLGVSPVGYVDEILFMDVNGSPATSNTCDADDPNKPAGTRRYFYHQDRNWNVVAVSEYGGDGVGTNGRLAERYAYTPRISGTASNALVRYNGRPRKALPRCLATGQALRPPRFPTLLAAG